MRTVKQKKAIQEWLETKKPPNFMAVDYYPYWIDDNFDLDLDIGGGYHTSLAIAVFMGSNPKYSPTVRNINNFLKKYER